MPKDADPTDALYQLPLAGFTAARDALAKRLGKDGAGIKALQKPNAPAWAVNQLYWGKRKAYDRLVSESAKLRSAHRAMLSGTPSDVAAAEAAHAAALKSAADEVRALLKEAGETASPATMQAVMETLTALPGKDAPGRLVRPLKPLGLEALAGLVPAAGAGGVVRLVEAPRKLVATSNVRPPATSSSSKKEAKRREDDAKREAEARKREAAALERDLREARAREREAGVALAKAKQTLSRSELARQRAQKALDAAIDTIQEARGELARCEREMTDASRAAGHIEDRLAFLKSAPPKASA